MTSREKITNSENEQISSAQLKVPDDSRNQYSLSGDRSDVELGTAQLRHEIRTLVRASKRKGDDDSTQLSLNLSKRLKTKKISSDSA